MRLKFEYLSISCIYIIQDFLFFPPYHILPIDCKNHVAFYPQILDMQQYKIEHNHDKY